MQMAEYTGQTSFLRQQCGENYNHMTDTERWAKPWSIVNASVWQYGQISHVEMHATSHKSRIPNQNGIVERYHSGRKPSKYILSPVASSASFSLSLSLSLTWFFSRLLIKIFPEQKISFSFCPSHSFLNQLKKIIPHEAKHNHMTRHLQPITKMGTHMKNTHTHASWTEKAKDKKFSWMKSLIITNLSLNQLISK